MFSSRYQRFLGILFICSITFCLWLGYPSLLILQEQQGEVVHAQSPDAGKLMQQGVESYHASKLQNAIKNWEAALKIYKNKNDRASEVLVNEYLARVYQQTGQFDNSIVHWDKVIAYYREVGNVGQVGRTLTEQAQVYNNLGQPRKVITLLCGVLQEDQEQPVKKKCLPSSALEIARAQKDEVGEVGALGSLGEAYRLKGSYYWAIEYLKDAEKIARKGYDFLVFNSLGNAYIGSAQLWKLRAESAKKIGFEKNYNKFEEKYQNDYKQAFDKFQSSLIKAEEQGNQFHQLQVLVNLIKLNYQAKSQAKQNNIDALIEKALTLREKLPDSTDKVYITIDLANLYVSTENLTSPSPLTQCLERQLPDSQALVLFKDAIKIADNIKDSRSKSFANGALGHFYECGHKYEQALEFTRNALVEADQKLLAQDSVYLWEWQIGRIFYAQKNSFKAVNAYQQAYSTLEKIRSDILKADKDLQFDFRDVVEPLYRDLAQLKLELSPLSSEREKQLDSAFNTIDSLRLAELQNYFGNDCIIAAINQPGTANNSLNKDTAVLSSIVFNDRTAILLSLPDGSKRLKWINETRKVLKTKVEEFRQSLIRNVKAFDDKEIQNKGKDLYDKIFGTFNIAVDLNPHKIKNLVFIQDSFFRSIPMAALYDGQQYLIQKYAIATTPSLSLTAPKKSNLQDSKALILAVTTAVEVNGKKFEALQYVESEIKKIESLFSNNTLLKNNEFNFDNLENKLKKNVYPIIHVSTHAQFGIIAYDTFLVTGNNNKIDIKQLETALRQVNNDLHSIELLTLTACQTAVGDDRATLGLAGVALQVGVKSAIASLWPVNDESTYNLISAFYTNLHNSNMSKAEALRQAQIKLINAKKELGINPQYSNPAFWAPFVLSGDWL